MKLEPLFHPKISLETRKLTYGLFRQLTTSSTASKRSYRSISPLLSFGMLPPLPSGGDLIEPVLHMTIVNFPDGLFAPAE